MKQVYKGYTQNDVLSCAHIRIKTLQRCSHTTRLTKKEKHLQRSYYFIMKCKGKDRIQVLRNKFCNWSEKKTKINKTVAVYTAKAHRP